MRCLHSTTCFILILYSNTKHIQDYNHFYKKLHSIMKNSSVFLLVICVFSFVFCASFFKQEDPLQASIKRGKVVYEANCASCHMEKGEGIEGVFPPLAKSDYLMADKKRSIKQVLLGAKGKMVVNGITYEGEMPASGLIDKETADVLNYIRNSWGNKGKIVTDIEVKAERK